MIWHRTMAQNDKQHKYYIDITNVNMLIQKKHLRFYALTCLLASNYMFHTIAMMKI